MLAGDGASHSLASAFFNRPKPEFRELIRPIRFASREEAACAVLLERYCSPWLVVPGETYAIKIGPREIDFKVGDSFIEYHPINLSREFDCRKSYFRLEGALKDCPYTAREEIKKCIQAEFEVKYYRRRRMLLDVVGLKHSPLIVVHNPKEFITNVLMRFATERPDYSRALQIFHEVVRSV